MIDSQVQAFAELGRLFRNLQIEGFDFVEAKTNKVTDSDILEDLRSTLEEGLGRVDRVYGVTFDGDATFKGKADQKISLGKSKVFAFTISPDQVYYKPINGDEVMQYAESDEGWAAMVEFAATKGKSGKSGRKLNCKPGNYQCGGKCQSDSRGCPSQGTPEQKAKVEKAVSKAKKTNSGATKAATASPEAVKKALEASDAADRRIDEAESKYGRGSAEYKKAVKESNDAFAAYDNLRRQQKDQDESTPEPATKKAVEKPAKQETETQPKPTESTKTSAKVKTPDDISDKEADKYIDLVGGDTYKLKNIPGARVDPGYLEVGGSKEYSRQVAKQYLSTPVANGAGSAAKLREGPKIESQKDFEKNVNEAIQLISEDLNSPRIVPIYRVRRALGDRVARDKFDEMLLKMQEDDKFVLSGGSVEDSSVDKIVDSTWTKVSGVRAHIKLN